MLHECLCSCLSAQDDAYSLLKAGDEDNAIWTNFLRFLFKQTLWPWTAITSLVCELNRICMMSGCYMFYETVRIQSQQGYDKFEDFHIHDNWWYTLYENLLSWIKRLTSYEQGHNMNIFQRGEKSFYLILTFPPLQNSHFGRPKTNFSEIIKSEMQKKKKKKKKKSSPYFVTFPPPSIFSIFHLRFPSFLLHFPFFPCLSFPGRSAGISPSEFSVPPFPHLLTPLLMSLVGNAQLEKD